MLNPLVSQKMRREADRWEEQEKPAVSTRILHVDMDAFFAAVEERDNPSLQGKPVIIGGPKGSRGVVTTCNYNARRYGVRSGMSLVEAGRLCPNGTYLKTYGRKYTWVSLRLMALLRRFSPKVEPYSVDEAFLDATGCAHLWGGEVEYGEAVKRAIRDELDLTGSVGIGPSRIVAKMASSLQKPDGLSIIMPDQVSEIFGPMPVEKIPGVGDSTRKTLNSMGIRTIHQLAAFPLDLLRARMGVNGVALGKIARGEGGDKVIALEERADDKSMGHEKTFRTDIGEPDVLRGCLLNLCDKVARRMRREKYVGNVVTLKLRLSNFRTFNHQRALGFFTDDPREIYTTASNLLEDLWCKGDGLIRLIGVSVSHLSRPGPGNGIQENLFKAVHGYRRRHLFSALDRLRDHYGEDILGFAGGMNNLGGGISRRSSP